MNILRKIKFRPIIVLSIIITLLLAQEVFAYGLITQGYYQQSVPINTTAGVLSEYTSPVNLAISSWNNAGTPCSIQSGSAPYKNILYTQEVDDTYYGVYMVLEENEVDYPEHSTTKFAIVINTNRCDSLSANAKRSVVCHEFGHVFGLNDLISGTAVMNKNRDRTQIYTPQGDDKLGVANSWE